MTKKEIFSKIMKLSFTEEVQPILELLELHIDRIEFVKDHIGLRDFLFIAEEKAVEYELPVFSVFDLEVDSNDSAKNHLLFHQSMIYDEDAVYDGLVSFLENTTRTLYVGIGFKESFLTNEDMFLAHELLKSKKVKDKFEAMSRVRRFPKWYKAKVPSDIIKEEQLLSDLEELEIRLLVQLKDEILEKINSAIDNDDKDTFSENIELYQRVLNEMQIEGI